MRKRNSNIIPVIILVFLAIFLYVNSRNTVKNNTNAPSASGSPAPAVTQTEGLPNSTGGTSVPQSTPINTTAPEKYKTETVKDLNLTINVPEQWEKKSQYDNRYEGDSGFAELTAMSGYGLSLKEASDVQINNELKPLGENPKITNTKVDYQEAAIITPTENNPNAQCAIIAKFPNPVVISGTPYYYLLVWTDRAHAEKLSNNIKFNK